MKDKIILIELLLEKAEQFAKTNIQLYRLKAIDRVTDIFASLVSKIVFVVLTSVFIFLFTIGLALYLGDLLGKTYYGFFAVGGFYMLLTIILIIVKKPIENIFNNYLINQIFKEKDNANNQK